MNGLGEISPRFFNHQITIELITVIVVFSQLFIKQTKMSRSEENIHITMIGRK